MQQFETVTKQVTGSWVQCRDCKHEWLYKGGKIYAQCPMCHAAIKVRPKPKASKAEGGG